MFLKGINFILRFLLCPLTLHFKSDMKVQSHKKYDVFACKRCGNLFAVKKLKYRHEK